MPSRISKTKKQLRRLFKLNKSKKKGSKSEHTTNSELSSNSSSNYNSNGLTEKSSKKKAKTLEYPPEDMFNNMNGLPIPTSVLGQNFLIEVGKVSQGWIIDCRNDDDDQNTNVILISRYDVPNSAAKSRPTGPPSLTLPEFAKSSPWVWYKDRTVFSKIESGKMSDTVAYVTGKIAVKGDASLFDGLEEPWNKAKELTAEMKKKNLEGGKIELGTVNELEELNGEDNEEEEEDDDDEEEEVDEEARILATFKPEVEPKNPFTLAFWRRHFGTDLLVGTWLFLVSSVGYQGLTIYNVVSYVHNNEISDLTVPELSQLAHTYARAFAAFLFVLGSIYFIKLSYPEAMMLMMYRAVTKDPENMTFIERYFTANEMLIALWLFALAIVLPIFLVMIYEILWLQAYSLAFQDFFVVIIATVLSGFLNVVGMPDAMRMNNGQGSSFFYDYVWAPLLCLKCSSLPCVSTKYQESRQAFWKKHLGNDGLMMGWLFAVVGVGGMVLSIPLVVIEPTLLNWLLFLTAVPFGVGSCLFLRASYPETMNSSFCGTCESSVKEDDEDEVVDEVQVELAPESNNEFVESTSSTPLLRK